MLNIFRTLSIIRSLRLFSWITTGWSTASACNTDTTPTQPHRNSNTHRTKNNMTNVAIQPNTRKLLMMDILMSKTCRVHKKWNKIASDIKLVCYSSTITMMHGPINIICPYLFQYLHWVFLQCCNCSETGSRVSATVKINIKYMFCHFVFTSIMAMPLWLTQNNWLPSTKQSKAPYKADSGEPTPIQFQLSHRNPNLFARDFHLNMNLISGLVWHLQLSFLKKPYAALFGILQ